MSIKEITIRKIEQKDNRAIAIIIRKTLEEFGANHSDTVYFDASTDALFELFRQTPRAVYFIAEKDSEVVGGGGIYPTDGLPEDTCELVKNVFTATGKKHWPGKKFNYPLY